MIETDTVRLNFKANMTQLHGKYQTYFKYKNRDKLINRWKDTSFKQ